MSYKNLEPFVGLLLLLTLALTACGDATPTATPGSVTNQAATTVVTQTATTSTTIAAVTTAAIATTATSPASSPASIATTAAQSSPTAAMVMITGGLESANSTATTAATRPATTPASTTKVSVTSATTSGSFSLPTISGLTEITVDPDVLQAARASISTLPATANLTVKIYGSNDDVQTTAANFDAAVLKEDYKSSLPPSLKSTVNQGVIADIYSKPGAADIVAGTFATPTTTQDLIKTSGVRMSTASAQKILDQLQGKLTMTLLIAAPDLLQIATGGSSGGSGTATPSDFPPLPTVSTEATPSPTK